MDVRAAVEQQLAACRLATDNGIAEKSRSDQTIAYFSYDSKTAGALTNFNASQNQWIRVRNNNMSFLQFKLFSDSGMQLATRAVTGNSITAIAGATNTVATGSGTLNSAGTYQQLVIPFTGSVSGVARGDGKWIRGKVFGDKVRFLDGSKADYSKAFYKFPTDKADKKVYDELVPKLEAL